MGVEEPLPSESEIRMRWITKKIVCEFSVDADEDLLLPYRDRVRAVANMATTGLTQAVPDVKMVSLTTDDRITPVIPLGDPTTAPATEVHSYARSVLDLAKRYQIFYSRSDDSTSFPVFPIAYVVKVFPDVGVAPPGVINTGPLAYFSQMYRCWEGNLRFMFTNSNPTGLMSVLAKTDPNFISPSWKYGAHEGAQDMTAIVSGQQTLQFQIPYTTRFKRSIVPWFSGEEKREQCSPIFLTMSFGDDSKTASTVPVNCAGYVCASDGFRLSCLSRVPTLFVFSAIYPKYRGTPFALPLNIKLVAGGHANAQLTLAANITSNCIVAQTLPATGGAGLTSFVVPAASFTDEQLQQLAYTIASGQSRSYGSTTDTKTFDNTPFGCAVMPNVVTISSTPSMTSTSTYSINASATSTLYSFTDDWGVPNQLSAGWSCTAMQNSTLPVFMERLSSATSYTYSMSQTFIPNAGTALVSLPQTASYYTGPGYRLTRFSNWSSSGTGAYTALGFGGPATSASMTSTSSSGTSLSQDYFEVKTHVVRARPQSNVMLNTGIPPISTFGAKVPASNVVTMGENVPSNISVVKKEQLVSSIVWDTNIASGQVLAFFQNPIDLIQSSVMQNAFKQYIYFRGSASFRVQTQSNAFQCGACALSFAPLMTSDQALRTYSGSLSSITLTPHLLFYAGKTQNVELNVPYQSIYEKIDLTRTSDFNTLGCFIITCFIPLLCGPEATSTSVNISIFARFDDAQFEVINPLADSVISQLRHPANSKKRFDEEFKSQRVVVHAPQSRGRATHAVPQGGVITKNTSYNFSNATLGTVDAKVSSDQFQGGDTPVTAADKPNSGINPVPMVLRPYPNKANANGPEFAPVLDLDTGSMVPVVETAYREDEMDLKAMRLRYSFHGKFVLSNANIIGDAVYTANICPCDETTVAAVGDQVIMSALSYSCLPFSYWRGSLRYKFIAVSTSSHTVRLQICSHIGFLASGITVDEAFSQYTCIFDVSGISECVVEFPWRSTTQWKRVVNGAYTDMDQFSMGQFTVRILNPLQAPEVVSSSIYVMVFVCGGDDFDVHYLGSNACDYLPYSQ